MDLYAIPLVCMTTKWQAIGSTRERNPKYMHMVAFLQSHWLSKTVAMEMATRLPNTYHDKDLDNITINTTTLY